MVTRLSHSHFSKLRQCLQLSCSLLPTTSAVLVSRQCSATRATHTVSVVACMTYSWFTQSSGMTPAVPTHLVGSHFSKLWWCLQCSYPAAICKVTIIANAALYEWLMFHTGYGVSFCMCFHPEVFDELWPFLHFKQEKQHALLFENLPALLWDSTTCTC